MAPAVIVIALRIQQLAPLLSSRSGSQLALRFSARALVATLCHSDLKLRLSERSKIIRKANDLAKSSGVVLVNLRLRNES